MVLDKQDSSSRKVIRKLDSEVKKARKVIRKKNDKKVEHLVKKFRLDCLEVPPRLTRYDQAKVEREDGGRQV